MNKMIFAAALAATAVSTSAFAQDAGGRAGWGQRDQTRQEAQQRADMLFQLLDANHDGVVTRAEAEQAAAQFQASRGGESGRGGGMMQRIIGHVFATSPSVNRQQFEGMMLSRFDAQDLNHDGIVTAAERQQSREQGRGGQPGGVAPVAPPPGAVPPPPRQ